MVQIYSDSGVVDDSVVTVTVKIRGTQWHSLLSFQSHTDMERVRARVTSAFAGTHCEI